MVLAASRSRTVVAALAMRARDFESENKNMLEGADAKHQSARLELLTESLNGLSLGLSSSL